MSSEPAVRNLLADLRKKAGFSQTEIARRLDCTQSKISKCEAAHTGNVTLNELAAYVAATQLAIGLQFFGEGLKVSFIGKDVAPTPINGNNGTHGPHPEPAQPRPDEQLASLESELSQLKTDKDALEAAIAELKPGNAQSEVETANLRGQLDATRQRNGELAAMFEQNLRAYRQEVEALGRQLEAAQHELAIAHRIMHIGQRERLREALLTPEEKQERAVKATVGTTRRPLREIVRPSCFG